MSKEVDKIASLSGELASAEEFQAALRAVASARREWYSRQVGDKITVKEYIAHLLKDKVCPLGLHRLTGDSILPHVRDAMKEHAVVVNGRYLLEVSDENTERIVSLLNEAVLVGNRRGRIEPYITLPITL